MRLRKAAALVLMGWYLSVPLPSCAAGAQGSDDSQLRDEIEHEWYVMCPPLTTTPPGVAVSAPFTQWRLGTHWPNRDVCEEQRAGAARAGDKFATSEKETLRVAGIALQHCRCFSSDDPRLDQTFVRRLKDFYLEEDYRHGLIKRPPK